MSRISEIYSSYKKSLDQAQDEYEESVKISSANARDFYNDFFKDLIINMGSKLDNHDFVDMIIDEIEVFFGKRELNFIAVDGSCHKHNSAEFISFYGGAYGAKGVLSLSNDGAIVEYKRWEIEKDVSMVAFVPVPYSRILEVENDPNGDNFTISESDKIELTSMHLPMMQLAEIFLAYNAATSSNIDSPDIILVDNSLSGMLGYTDFGADKVRLVGSVLSDGMIFSKQDVLVAQAHPFNKEMGVPSSKKFTETAMVIQYLHEHNPDIIDKDRISSETKIPRSRLDNVISKLARYDIVRSDAGKIRQNISPYESWEKTKAMFQRICKAIFLDKRENALKHEIMVDGKKTSRWMSPDDVRFLIAIGLRALIEECWAKKILLTGIAKDSASTYLTKNYLGVCRYFGKYPQLSKEWGILPPTDRVFCELLPYISDDLNSPWGTIEFDSTFMTLRIENQDGKERFGGTFGGITRPECLFLRSIAQFYTRRNTESPLTGHAIFVDRLAFAQWDGAAQRIQISDDTVGDMNPLFYPSKNVLNTGQLVTYFLLNTLTKNHFAEVIGYPDPLHKADQGAKSMRDNVKKLLESSEIKFRSRPLINTLREIRQSFGR